MTIPPPVSIKFPEVVAAVRVVEERPWKIGDALIKECGRPGEHGVNTGVYAKIRQCSHELRRLNLKGYCFDHLRELWRTAANFPDGERSPSVDFSLYSEAGDPATLKLAMEAADRKGIGITVKYIKHFKKLQRQGEEYVEDRQSAKTIAKLDFETALADLLDLGVPATEVMKIIHASYDVAQRWPDFVAAFEEYCLPEAA